MNLWLKASAPPPLQGRLFRAGMTGKTLATLSALVLLLAACVQSRTSPSTLQSFDELRGQFSTLTAQSRRVSIDVQRLARSMQDGNQTGVRSIAVRLKGDAQVLSAEAGRAGYAVRSLAAHDRRSTVRTYFSLTIRTLCWDWLEGKELAELADAAWADPLVATRPDEERLSMLSGKAQRYASMAVRSAERAARWKKRFASAFRYVPVLTPVREAGKA